MPDLAIESFAMYALKHPPPTAFVCTILLSTWILVQQIRYAALHITSFSYQQRTPSLIQPNLQPIVFTNFHPNHICIYHQIAWFGA